MYIETCAQVSKEIETCAQVSKEIETCAQVSKETYVWTQNSRTAVHEPGARALTLRVPYTCLSCAQVKETYLWTYLTKRQLPY
jgi:hypothetical protein